MSTSCLSPSDSILCIDNASSGILGLPARTGKQHSLFLLWETVLHADGMPLRTEWTLSYPVQPFMASSAQPIDGIGFADIILYYCSTIPSYTSIYMINNICPMHIHLHSSLWCFPTWKKKHIWIQYCSWGLLKPIRKTDFIIWGVLSRLLGF